MNAEFLIKNRRFNALNVLLRIRAEYIDLCLDKDAMNQNLINHLRHKCGEVDQLEIELMQMYEKLNGLEHHLTTAQREINERDQVIRELRHAMHSVA